MRIFYSYELGSTEQHYQQHFLIVDDWIISRGLSYEILINLLEKEQAMINHASVLSYYNESKKAYVALKRDDILPISSDIKILIRKGHSKEIQELLQRIESLQIQVQTLEDKLENREKQLSSKPKPLKLNINHSYSEIDIAIFHAAPLAYVNNSRFSAYDESRLDFETEKRFFLQNLKAADIRFEAATPENFDELLEYMPKIIVIMSQSYCKAGEFVLAFEKHDPAADGKGEVGLVYEISASKMNNMLMATTQYMQVAVVKGRYSQEMGRMLLKAGFGCVVAVHELEEDKQSMKFITDFCNGLLDGKSIEYAYKSAEKAVEVPNKGQCCCAHPHKPSCQWVKQIQIFNPSVLHLDHSNETCCGLEGFLHKLDCPHAHNFNETYNCINRVPTEYEVNQGAWSICCCSPELHFTNQKFAILLNDQSILDQVLFESNRRSKLEVRSALSAHLKPPNIEKFTVGRKQEIREILMNFLNFRCVNVVGPCGVGKTMTIKRAAQYAYERRLFKDGAVYLDFLMRTDIKFLNRYIANTLNLPTFRNNEDLCAAISELDVLLIIDNIDSLLKQDSNCITEIYTYMLTNTVRPKFLIATQVQLELKGSIAYKIPSLKVQQAKLLLDHLNRHNGNFNVEIPSQLFDCIGTMPADILQISPLLSQCDCTQIIMDANLAKAENTSICSVSISLSYINKKFPSSQTFLKLLSYFPSGIFKLNIKYLCENLVPDYLEIFDMLKKEGKSTGTWFIHAEKDFEFVLLRSNVANYFESIVEDTAEMITACVEHLAVFSRGILKAILNSGASIGAEIRSSLSFINVGIGHGIWSSQVTPSLIHTEIKDPTSMFTKIEANIWNYINIQQIKKLFKKSPISQTVALALGEIMLCSTAIFILLGKIPDAHEMIARGKICCKELNIKKTKKLLMLTEASLILPENPAKALELVESCKKYFCDIEDNEGQAECHFLKVLIRQIADPNADPRVVRMQSARTDIEKEFDLAILLFNKAKEDVGYARVQLAYAEFQLKNGLNEQEIFYSLENAIKIFSNGYDFWETRAKISLSDWYYHGHSFINAREHLRSIRIKKKDVNNEMIIASKLREINEKIRRTNKNLISMFKSFSLVEKASNGHVIRAGSIWRHSSTFRQDMHKRLEESKKEICVRMEIGSRENLKEYLREKCLILHLSSDVVSATHLNLEGPRGMVDKLSFTEFGELVEGSLSNYVELMVLSMPFSLNFAKFCHDELGVKHVVCFNFLDHPQDGDPVQIAMTIETAMNTFCLEFYTHVVSGESVKNSFNKAKVVMEDYISEKVRHFPHLKIGKKTFSEWWKDHDRNEPILITDFGNDQDECLILSDYSGGSFIEMNSPRGPCNIYRDKLKPFAGRQIEFYNALSALEESHSVHIIGEEGSGKTEFISQVGYFLNVRNQYPDGIFLLDLKEKSSLNEVYELLQEVGLAFYSADIEPSLFLYQRKMLLILDNCDELYSRAEHTFNSLLSMFLHDCQISLMMTSSIQITTPESYNVKRFALRNLSRLESLVMLTLGNPYFTAQLLETEAEQMKYEMVIKGIIKFCKGLPKEIVVWAKRIEDLPLEKVIALISPEEEPSESPDDEKEDNMEFPIMMLNRSSTIHESDECEFSKQDT